MGSNLKLIYIWIKSHKNIKRLSIHLSGEYNFRIKPFEGHFLLMAFQVKDYVRNPIFEEKYNFICVTGNMGVGKSALLDVLCSENVQKLLIYQDIKTRKLYYVSNVNVTVPTFIQKIQGYPSFKYISEGTLAKTVYSPADALLSTGERNLGRFNKTLDKYFANGETNLCIDAIDGNFPPKIQMELIYNIINNIKKYGFNFAYNIFIVTYSPFIISDFPRERVLNIGVSPGGNPKLVSNINSLESIYSDTFAGNIHSIISDCFEIEDIMGKYAQSRIQDAIIFLNNKKLPTSMRIQTEIDSDEKAKMVIDSIGEKILNKILYKQYARSLKVAKDKQQKLGKSQDCIQELY